MKNIATLAWTTVFSASGFWTVKEMDRRTAGAEVFDRLAKDYDSWFDNPKGKALFKAEVESVEVLMKSIKAPLLEVGVGSGRFAEALSIGHGIDPSDALIEKALKRGVSVVKSVGEALPFKDGVFGGVFILFTLCFVENPIKVIAEARRVLKPGGGMIIGIINSRSTWGRLYAMKKAEGHPLYEHARFYTSDEVVDMLEKSGLSVEAFSSTLLSPPSDNPCAELVLDRFQEEAGFICILSRNRH